jgi:hypothetical protein
MNTGKKKGKNLEEHIKLWGSEESEDFKILKAIFEKSGYFVETYSSSEGRPIVQYRGSSYFGFGNICTHFDLDTRKYFQSLKTEKQRR